MDILDLSQKEKNLTILFFTNGEKNFERLDWSIMKQETAWFIP